MSKPTVLIVGAGVAGLETLMALRHLAGDLADVALIAPEEEFVDRPMLVAEPFGTGRPRRHSLPEIAADHDAGLIGSAVVAVDAAQRRVVVSSGASVTGDFLVIASGARRRPVLPGAITFPQTGASQAIGDMLAALEHGEVRRVAFVAPSVACWTLPLYELALMTAHRIAARAVRDAELFLITPESAPLAVFGSRPSAMVERLLRAAGIEFIGSTYAEAVEDGLALGVGGPPLAVDRVVALPLLVGAAPEGVPARPPYGFVPVDRHGRVAGLEHVYAAGDVADLHVKQGGLAAQQADVVAADIASELGAPVDPQPFRPVLRGMLLTGAEERFLRTRGGRDDAAWHPLWWPPTKIAGRHLAPYLFAHGKLDAPALPPAPFMDLEVPLSVGTVPD